MPRTLLTSDTTWYVDPVNGSDSNDGSQLMPWQSVQTAAGKIARDYDFHGFIPAIQLAAGTYGPLTLPMDYLSGTTATTTHCPTILGDTAHPENYIFDGAGGIGVFGSCNMPWKFKGVKFQSSGGVAIEMDEKGHIFLEGVDFGAADIHCHSILDSVFKFVNSGYRISGSALVHWNANPMSKIMMQPGYGISLSGTPDFSVAFAQVDGGYVEAQGVSVSGSATGKRYAVSNGGRLSIGTTVLPGNVAGTVSGTAWVI